MVSLPRDITERKQAEKALIESEKKYRTLFEQSADAILIIEDDKFVDCNLATIKMLGYKRKEELLDIHPSQLSPEIQPDGRNSLEKANEMMSIAYAQGSHHFEWDHKRKNGEVFPVEVLLTAVPYDEKKILHVVWQDITERKLSVATLQESNARFIASFAHAPIGMAISFGRILIDVNEAFCEMLGYSKDEIIGVSFNDITVPDDINISLDRYHKLISGEIDNYQIEKRYIHKQGHEIWCLLSVTLVLEKNTTVLSHIQDITERKQMEDELKYSATHDALTGLYNRNVLDQRLNDEIHRASRYNHAMSVFMLDIDHFKSINDTYGHRSGDTILHNFAKLLESSIRNTDYAARYGGEEFIVILPETPLAKAEELAERLRKRIAEYSFLIEPDKQVKLTVSIGIATFPELAQSPQNLLEVADSAMYAAKEAGRNQVKTP